MMKRVLMTSALCGVMAAGGLAQAQTSTPPQAGSQMQSGSSGAAAGSGDFIATQDQGSWLADDLIGTTVKNGDEDIGEIENLLVDSSGKAMGVVISVGEFLGVGGKNVAVPFDKLSISPDPNDPSEHLVSVTYTKEQLEQAAPFQTLADERQDSATPASGTGATGAAPATGAPPATGGGMGTAPGTTR